MSSHTDPDALGSDAVTVGTLDAGPVATVGPGGVVDWGAARLSWWVRAEDRWHRPDREASQRRRRVEGRPVVETAIRVPGGDVVATAFGAVLGDGTPGVVVEVRNDCAVPVALALVVESRQAMSVEAAGVAVADGGAVHVTREVRDRRRSTDADGLLAELERPSDGLEGLDRVRDTAGGPGDAVALVVPLPHTATVATLVGPTGTPGGLGAPAVPPATGTQVRAGWDRLIERLPHLDLPDPLVVRRWTAACCDTVLGASGSVPVALGRQVADGIALGRLGLLDEADALVDDVLGAVRRDGSLHDVDPVDETAGLLLLAAALWSGGLEADVAEQLVGPVARAARWLERGRRRPPLGDRTGAVAGALVAAVGLAADLDQPDLARHLAQVAGARVGSAPEGAATVGESAGPRGTPSSGAGTAAATVVEVLDGVVREVPSGLRLGAAWVPAWAGSAVEVHGVPTRWGQVSWALRWHGERPALLWEVERWPDRRLDPPRVSTPALDPAWSGSGWSGEALLAAPVSLVAGEGGSFS